MTIEKARESAAEIYPASRAAILNGEWDASNHIKCALRALSAAASEREQLEARVKTMEEALKQIAAFVPKDKSDGGTVGERREWNRAGAYASGIARAALEIRP